MPPDPLLYTLPEAAAALRIGKSKMFQLIADGTIQSVQIGRSRRIPRAALEQYVTNLAEGDAA